MSSCILFRIYCKNSDFYEARYNLLHKNVYVENVKKREFLDVSWEKESLLKKYWEYKRLEYYLYSGISKILFYGGVIDN